MKKEFNGIIIEIVFVKEDVILYSGLITNSVDGLEQDDDFMSED